MYDLSFLREHYGIIDEHMKRRGITISIANDLIAIDKERREAISACEVLLSQRRKISTKAGVARQEGDQKLFEQLRQEQLDMRSAISEAESLAEEKDNLLMASLMEVPNLLAEDVPDGGGEEDNVEVYRRGEIPVFCFSPKKHHVLGEQMGMMDSKISGGKISGSRFSSLKGPLARLHRVLAEFMIGTHVTRNNFEEYMVPVLVRENILEGSGHLPKFREDLYKIEGNDLWLIPTAETYLTHIPAFIRNLSDDMLPLRYVAYTECFRSEAGSAGRDMQGMFRQHQFGKVELVAVAHPDESANELEYITKCAEGILNDLEISYRKVLLCSADTGFSSMQTFDLEVWLPGEEDGVGGLYREISSCSLCGDFQSRRMGMRCRDKDGGKIYPHTLNGSGVAVGRCMIAVMENYQTEDGGIEIPRVLRPMLGGAMYITPMGEFAL